MCADELSPCSPWREAPVQTKSVSLSDVVSLNTVEINERGRVMETEGKVKHERFRSDPLMKQL